jgi:AAA family ATP:ADP antiporter
MDTRQDDHRRGVGINAVLGATREARLRTLGLFALFFLVIAAFWVQKPIRTSRFLSAVGSEYLPLVKLGTALLVLPVVLLYSSAAARYRRESLVYLCAGVFGVASLVFWWLFARSSATTWSSYVYFFYVDIFNSVMVALFWSFANDLNDPEQARRSYGVIGAGGIVGGAAGSALTGWSVEHIGAPNLLLVCVALLAAIAAIARLVAGAHSDSEVDAASRPQAGARPRRDASLREALAGARLTFTSRYLLAVAAVVVAYEIVSNIVDFQFNTMVAARYRDETAIAAFLGQFSTAANVGSLLVQVVVTTWILRHWGPRVGLLVLPIVLGLGSAGFLVVPAFAVIAATFFSDAALAYSLNQSSKEVLYTPTDEAAKYQAKAFIDMFLMRLAKAASSLVILACMAWWLPRAVAGVHWLGLVSLAVVVGWIAVAYAVGRSFSRQTEARGAPAPSPATGPVRRPTLAAPASSAGGMRA